MATVRTSRYYQNFSTPNENTPEENNIVLPQDETSSQTMQQTESENVQDNVSPQNEGTPPANQPQTTPEPLPSTLTENTNTQNTNSNENFAPENSNGAISVQVLTARGTRPVPDSTVIVYKNSDGENGPFSFGLTDADGRTPRISAPAPDRSDAQSPSDTLPFSDYNILVENPKYYTAEINNVQVFGDELTILTVELIPLPELVNETNTTKTTTIPKQNL